MHLRRNRRALGLRSRRPERLLALFAVAVIWIAAGAGVLRGDEGVRPCAPPSDLEASSDGDSPILTLSDPDSAAADLSLEAENAADPIGSTNGEGEGALTISFGGDPSGDEAELERLPLPEVLLLLGPGLLARVAAARKRQGMAALT